MASGKAPRRFQSWGEALEALPVTTRRFAKENLAALTDQAKRPQWYRVTGGSTGEPIQLPAWQSETLFTRPDAWLARSWWGVTPASKIFWLWGHYHLLGSGLKGKLGAYRRALQDRVFGYGRFPVYDLSEQSMRAAAREILSARPDCLLGYSAALDVLARVNQDLRNELRGLGLKVVLASAERFPDSDSPARLEDLFGCPVAMEYGSLETNVIAHMHPEGGYRVFWHTYFVEAVRTDGTSPWHRIRLTSLYPRAFPLVRYELGDGLQLEEVQTAASHVKSLVGFRAVVGRLEDYVRLPDGTVLHPIVFDNAVKPCSSVAGYQARQNLKTGSIALALRVIGRTVSDSDLRGIRYRLARIHPTLSSVAIETVEQLPQSIAGKTPLVVKISG